MTRLLLVCWSKVWFNTYKVFTDLDLVDCWNKRFEICCTFSKCIDLSTAFIHFWDLFMDTIEFLTFLEDFRQNLEY